MELVPNGTPAFLTITQFRCLTGVSRGLAYRLIRAGALHAVRLGERGAIRIPRGELERFLKSRRYESAMAR